MTSSVIPSLKKSWPASPDRFLNGSTATEGRAGEAIRRGKGRDFDRLGRGAKPEQVSARTRVKRPHRQGLPTTIAAAPAAATMGQRLLLRPRCRGRHAYRVSANRLGDILDAMAAERVVIEIELVPDLLVDGLGDANGARLGERLEPGGDVDAIAKDVVAIDDHVAKIDTDPELETPFRRDGVVDGTRCSLHLDGAVQRVDDARKIRQQAVARGADDPSAVRGDQRVDSAAELDRALDACPLRPRPSGG